MEFFTIVLPSLVEDVDPLGEWEHSDKRGLVLYGIGDLGAHMCGLCGLTFEVTRPARWDDLPAQTMMKHDGCAGKAARLAGSRVERGVRPRPTDGNAHLMKYPMTRHDPSDSRVVVTVSIAVALLSKLASNCMTTYCPSGAPGRDVVACDDLRVRLRT